MSARRAVPAVEPVAMSTQLVEEIVGGLEVVPAGRLDEQHARMLDERIRLTAGTVRERMTRLAGLVEQAKAGELWDVLGFPSWTAYLADALGGQLHVDTAERRELVGMLAGEGMSTRAMAPIVGASPRTVARDVEALDLPGVSDGTPAVVVGLDGKAYTSTVRGKRGYVGEHVIRRDDSGWWTCLCDFQCGSDYDANEHARTKHGRYVLTSAGGRVVATDDYRSAGQQTIEGTEPERMVPTLPGLGVSQQPPAAPSGAMKGSDGWHAEHFLDKAWFDYVQDRTIAAMRSDFPDSLLKPMRDHVKERFEVVIRDHGEPLERMRWLRSFAAERSSYWLRCYFRGDYSTELADASNIWRARWFAEVDECIRRSSIAVLGSQANA